MMFFGCIQELANGRSSISISAIDRVGQLQRLIYSRPGMEPDPSYTIYCGQPDVDQHWTLTVVTLQTPHPSHIPLFPSGLFCLCLSPDSNRDFRPSDVIATYFSQSGNASYMYPTRISLQENFFTSARAKLLPPTLFGLVCLGYKASLCQFLRFLLMFFVLTVVSRVGERNET